MEDTIKLIGQYGGLVILAGLFVWTYFQDKSKKTAENEKRDKENQEMLIRMDKSNENIAKSIDAINNTTEVLKEYIIKHDERAKRIDDNVAMMKEKVDKIC